MRSNWEIHGGVPCRAWQAAGIGMGEGRERHAMELHRLHRNSTAACSCSSAPHLHPDRATCPYRPFPSLAMWVCRWGPTHPCLTQESHARSETCPEPSSAGAAQCWLHPLQPKRWTWAPHHPGEGETISFIGISVSFRPCPLDKLIGTSVPHQTLAVLLGLEVCSSVWIEEKGRNPKGFLLQT